LYHGQWEFGAVEFEEITVFQFCNGRFIDWIFNILRLEFLLLGEGYAKSMGLNFIRVGFMDYTKHGLIGGCITAFLRLLVIGIVCLICVEFGFKRRIQN